MTLADLQEHVWRRMPLRKHAVGRKAVDEITTLVVENWPAYAMQAASDDAERQEVAQGIAAAVKRARGREYGFLWTLLLQAVLSAAIQLIIKWWLERRSHRALLCVWQHELTA